MPQSTRHPVSDDSPASLRTRSRPPRGARVIAAALVGLGAAHAAAQPADTTAQKPRRGLLGVLDRADRLICGPNGAACATPAGAHAAGRTPAGGGPVGGRVQVVSQRVDGDPRAGAAYDTAGRLGEQHTPGICGPGATTRPCLPGAHLRLIAIRTPGDTLPASATIPVTLVLENRGAVASRPSDLQVCYAGGEDVRGNCRDRADQLDLPALAPGERVEITRPLRLKPYGYYTSAPFRLVALLDPAVVAAAASDRERAPRVAVTRPLQLEAPALQWLGWSGPETVAPGRDLDVEIRVRNASRVAASPATEIVWSKGRYPEWGGTAEYRTPLPALQPGQAYVATVRLHPANAAGGQLGAAIDPDKRAVWGVGHEAEHWTALRAVPR